ncbi:MAG: glycosyltransferase family protein, partial [Methylobacter sp.]
LVKDIFFLNIEDAYSEALKQNKIVDQQGERLQYCYYDGLLTDIVLDNFIQVPADDFVKFFSHNRLPIPQVIAISQDGVVHFNEMPADVIDEIKQYRSKYRVVESIHFDTYFVDPLLALNVAKQKNRVYCEHPTIDGLQLCYYRGELPEHGIKNLVHVELHDFVDFFILSKLRLPEMVEIPGELEEELKLSVREDMAKARDDIIKKRTALIQQLTQKAKAQKPVVVDGEPMRIAILSSRLTTVMQYCSRGVAKAFEKRGWQVLFHIEANDMEINNHIDRLSKFIDFNPHAVFCVNALFNTFFHDDVINIIWWQDPMPQIESQELLNWRQNDFNFSVSPIFDQYLKQCGAETVERQHFVVDEDLFYVDTQQQRQQNIVFVGTSYRSKVDYDDAQQQQAIAELAAILNRGGCFDQQTVTSIADRSSLTYEFVFWKLLFYVIRDYSVKWLCQNSTLPVEIYGRYWDQDPVVTPFFRGELPHGVEVAKVYRLATYAIVSHAFEINSQRLAEVAACGCIPVVYDCRDVAEPPHWDEYCLFFKTEEDLKNIINNRLMPSKSPILLAQHFTYDAAVDYFIEKSAIKTLITSPAVDAVATQTESVLFELFGDNVILHSRTPNTIQTCRDRLLKNMAILKNNRHELYNRLIEGIQGKKIDIAIDKLIESEYWEVSLVINGNNYYQLDNVALLGNCRLIRDNSTYYQRENTSCYVLLSLGSGYELLAAFNNTERPIPEMAEFEVPVYIIEQEFGLFVLNMLLHDWEQIITSKRIQFFYDKAIDRFYLELQKNQAALPTVLLDMKAQGDLMSGQVLEFVNRAELQRNQRHAANLQEINKYYGRITDSEWRDKFKAENIASLRVMGFISRFSSFLKYCMRDLMDGFDRTGAMTTICIEEENYYLSSIEHFIDEINRFKPDIILTIDHFRHEFDGVPESIPFVNWIQDMLPNITGNKQALKAKDFTFVFAKAWLGLNEFPTYKNSPIEFLPLGYNDKIYFPIEEKNYDCDVLVVTHLQDPERTFAPIRTPEEFKLLLNENEVKIIETEIISEVGLVGLYRILDEYLSSLKISEFHEFCTIRGVDNVDEFNAIFLKKNITLEPLLIEVLFPLAGNRLHCEYLSKMKTWPISLLIDSQLDINIHVYGKNWDRYPMFKDFAKGTADNGEYINRIMNNARICLNVNPGVTLHMRALEIIASCSFMLSRRTEFDGSPLSDYFSDEQVVLYDDEDDFLNKINFYIRSEYERNRIAKNTLTRAQEIFSYKAIAENILSSLNARLFG